MCFGGILLFVGFLIMLFVINFILLYIIYGFFWGVGVSFCYFVFLVILLLYFRNYLLLVYGIVIVGVGLGVFLMMWVIN